MDHLKFLVSSDGKMTSREIWQCTARRPRATEFLCRKPNGRASLDIDATQKPKLRLQSSHSGMLHLHLRVKKTASLSGERTMNIN